MIAVLFRTSSLASLTLTPHLMLSPLSRATAVGWHGARRESTDIDMVAATGDEEQVPLVVHETTARRRTRASPSRSSHTGALPSAPPSICPRSPKQRAAMAWVMGPGPWTHTYGLVPITVMGPYGSTEAYM